MTVFMRNKYFSMLLLAIAIAVGMTVSGCSKSDSTAPGGKQMYHCPMHPTYVSDRPGDCPICNMKLVPIRDDQPAPKAMASAPAEKTAHIKVGQFYCPMHPEVVSNAPGTCPECEMHLIEKKAVAQEAAVPGRISFSLSPEKRQQIGLTLAEVKTRDLSRVVRTAAIVEHDETRYAKISPRFAGWVRQLHVNYTGAPVEKGDPLFTVYSPELFSTENEYLVAWRAAQPVREGTSTIQKDSANSLLESARLRMSLLQIGEEEIRALEKRGKPSAELLFRAPFSGHVIVKNAVEGSAFQAGDALYEIADLSHVWLRAYVFEYDMPLISLGQEAQINFPYLNNRSFDGKVTFIYPHFEPQTRRGQIRLELDNPEHLLRPEMWANVEIKADAGEHLTVPASAVINTGQRYVAFVEGAEHHLEPREVKVGIRTDDYYEVISGLNAGEQVVARALFLVDSESQLKAAIAGMGAAGGHQH
ncbi:MAG TPA: efflux RND transporter periplasmic adaptor subunit [Clostridia bacterium]|nr:efflux RND transporter periplasmic adaptor subunit [Clostridia bacterium]